MEETEKKKFVQRPNKWTVAPIWNATLESKEERPIEPRGHIWASELGKPNIEIFLKMRGVVPTNPPNARSKRKFEAGNTFEWLLGIILKRAGVYKEGQTRIEHQYPGLLKVTGRIDYIAGGVPDHEHYREKLESLELPEFFMRAAKNIVEYLSTNYPEGLGDLPLEIKSTSSFMMNGMELTGRALRNHRLQLFCYLKAINYPRGNVVYICRDDMRMLEIAVENPSDVEEEYRKVIEEISGYYARHKDTPIESFLIKPDSADELKWKWVQLDGLPELEKFIVWDNDLKKFSRNWGVEYSSYLTMLYGFENQLAFEEVVMPIVARWNRVLGRVKVNLTRVEWLYNYGATEDTVQIEKTPKTAEAKATKKQFVMRGDEKIYLPEEICKGYEMTAKNVEVIQEIRVGGFIVEELAKEYADGGEEEEDTAIPA